MYHKFSLTNSFIMAALVLTASPITASIITVTSAGNSGAGTLRQAISDAFAGDTINFAPSLTTVTLTSAELLIDKNLAINGPGANRLRVERSTASGTANFRILEIATATTNVTISGLTIANGNLPGGFGGGIFNSGGTVSISSCNISGNTAALGGGIGNNSSNGAVSDVATLTLTGSTISANSAGTGGGINNFGVMTITNSTITGNAAISGGGINNDDDVNDNTSSTLTLINSTVAGNSTSNGGSDGAHIANAGGGLYSGSEGGSVSSKNTIIARNTAATGPDCNGTVASQGYNLIGDNQDTGITPTTGDQIGTSAAAKDPKLGPLQDNGGSTQTMALLSGSTAIEGGNSGTLNTDQRGLTRPVNDPIIANASGGDGSDIGAFEVQGDQLPGCKNINFVVGNTNDSGAASLRDVIGNVCAGTTITFAPNVRGAINLTSGELALNKGLQINGPGANLLTVQRSAAAGNFRVFHITGNYSVAISGLTIANGNATANLGGGISNDNGALTLSNATVSGNTADIGAGIYTARAATIINSTISNNVVSGNLAGDGGGGIYNQGGSVAVTNSTISGNTAHIANGGAQGGGIHNSLGTATLTSSTISNNSGDFGGGIYNGNNGTVNSFNTIMALNTSASGPDVNGALTSQGFNLIGNVSGAAISPAQFSDQIGVSAAQLNLGPLQDNGGTTFTHALLSGSFAIDKGNSGGSVMDERAFSRPHDDPNIANVSGGDGSDIGAFEFGSTSLLKITSITHMANGHVLLQCIGVPNQTNNLQFSPDLTVGSFMTVSPLPPAADDAGAFQYDDAGAVGLTKRFHRLTFP